MPMGGLVRMSASMARSATRAEAGTSLPSAYVPMRTSLAYVASATDRRPP